MAKKMTIPRKYFLKAFFSMFNPFNYFSTGHFKLDRKDGKAQRKNHFHPSCPLCFRHFAVKNQRFINSVEI